MISKFAGWRKLKKKLKRMVLSEDFLFGGQGWYS
jgi:hypothetical protein